MVFPSIPRHIVLPLPDSPPRDFFFTRSHTPGAVRRLTLPGAELLRSFGAFSANSVNLKAGFSFEDVAIH